MAAAQKLAWDAAQDSLMTAWHDAVTLRNALAGI
jgi:hypothetical protein